VYKDENSLAILNIDEGAVSRRMPRTVASRPNNEDGQSPGASTCIGGPPSGVNLCGILGRTIPSPRLPSPLLHQLYKTDVAQVWRVVRELTGKPQSSAAVPGITADILNRHYAAISTDSDYHNPAPKLTAAANIDDVITEWQVFKVLDRLRPIYSHRTRSAPSLVPQTGCSCICQASGQIVQLINVYLYGAVPVETGMDPTSFQSCC
jgi:hypothetical protein